MILIIKEDQRRWKEMIAKQKVNSKWIRDLIEVSIIWNGDPISCMKTFGDDHCMLCMREKN